VAYRKFETLELFSVPEIVKQTDNRWAAMDISPDGSQVVFKWSLSGVYELYVVPLVGGEPRRITTTEKISQCVHPRWSPNGDLIAFLRDQGGDRHFHVWLVDPRTGSERLVSAEPVVAGDSRIEWTPDGARLAFRSWEDEMRGIWMLDIATGATRRIVEKVDAGGLTGDGVIPSFSHDGRYMAYQTGRVLNQRGEPRDEVICVTTADGSAEPTIIDVHPGGRGRAQFPRWSPSDDALAFSTDVRGRFEVALLPMRDGKADGEVRYLTSSSYDENMLGWGGSGRILYRRSVDGTVLPCRIDPRTGKDETLLEGIGVCFAMREAPDGTVAWIWASPLTPPDLWIAAPGNAPRRVTQSMPASIDPSSLVRPRHVRYPGADGVPQPAVLYEPMKDALAGDPGTRPPAIVMAHGGGTRQSFMSWDPIAQFFANNGYVVIQPNQRGSKGYGREHREGYFARAVPGNPMTTPQGVGDHVTAADWLEREGLADGRRIAITGPSAGAIITVAALVQAPDRFAAGCASRGAGSTVDLVDQLRTPLLVLAGRNDPMVPVAMIDAFVARLRERGKTHDAHIYPDEGHGYRNPANMRDAFERQIAFYEKYVRSRVAAAT
jgi:dipeptidyl aminopeptidase/acylaminoacyl peptidase